MFGPQRMRGVHALRAQAAAWLEDYREHLVARGLGFTDDDLRVIAESHAAHPHPEGTDPAGGPGLGQKVGMVRALVKTIFTRFPVGGIPVDDPRIAPVHDIPLVTYAVAARAIGWSPDEAFATRVVAALGADPSNWKPACKGWTERLLDDMQVATFYGQLYAQADPLPRRPVV
jgi:hypothetical protein